MEFITMEFMFLEQRIKRAVSDKGTNKGLGKLRMDEVQEEKEEEPVIYPLDISVSKDWVFREKFGAHLLRKN